MKRFFSSATITLVLIGFFVNTARAGVSHASYFNSKKEAYEAYLDGLKSPTIPHDVDGIMENL